MLRTSRRFARVALVLTVACVALQRTAQARPGADGSSAHHVSITGGYARYLYDVRTGSSFPGGAREFGLRYRHAVRPGAEVYAALDRIEASGTDVFVDMGASFSVPLRHRTDTFGVGYRSSDMDGRVRPFLEVGFAYAREWSGDDESLSKDGSSFGIATTAGAEFAVARALSIPVELGLRFAMPIEGVTTLGVRSGLTWHLGRARADTWGRAIVPPADEPSPSFAATRPPESRGLAASASAKALRYHISIQGGIGGHVGGIGVDSYAAHGFARSPGYAPASAGVIGSGFQRFLDLAPGTTLGLTIQNRIRPGADFVIDLGRAVSRRRETFGMYREYVREVHYTTWIYGLGVRKLETSGSIRPFAQAGVALMGTVVRNPSSGARSDIVTGLAASFGLGAQAAVSRTLSVPVECRTLIGLGGSDQMHIGLRAGLEYGFGKTL